jgi:hypothetical protein
LKNGHLRRSPHPSSLQRTFKYASLLRISGALHLGIFDQPEKLSFSTGSLILMFMKYQKAGLDPNNSNAKKPINLFFN